MKMRSWKRILSLMLAVGTLVGLMAIAGCGDGKRVVSDPKVINIKMYKGGYGTSWLYSLKEKFEALYEEENYKINIINPSSDIAGSVVTNELAVGGGGVDLWFTGPVSIYAVTKINGILVEDLTDTVWNKPAIRFDGTEEEGKIIDKVVPGMTDAATMDDRLYGFFYVASPTAMAVNTRKLGLYGLDIPRTTDELIHAFHVITTGEGTDMGTSEMSNIFPHTYFAGSNGYPLYLQYTLLAQYLGYDTFMNFLRLCDEEGNFMVEDGYKQYSEGRTRDGLEEVLSIMYRVFDQNHATYGVGTQDVNQAQSKLMQQNGGAVFMINGDWMLNEVKMDYEAQLNNIDFMRIPMISKLGEELFGNGTALNLTREAADALYSDIIGKVDEGKSVDEIVSWLQSEKGYTYAAIREDILRIWEARGLYNCNGTNGNVYITKNALAKEPAMLFLRMFASDDAVALFESESNCTSAFATKPIDSDYQFVKSASQMVRSANAQPYNRTIYDSLRVYAANSPLSAMYPKTGEFVYSTIMQQNVSIYDESYHVKSGDAGNVSIYSNAAALRLQEEIAYATESWSIWMENVNV